MKMILLKTFSFQLIMALYVLTGIAQDPMAFQENMQRLNGLTPLTSDQMQQCLPETLGDLPRTGIKTEGSTQGVSIIEGTYVTAGEPEFIETTSAGGVTGTGDALNENHKTFVVEVTDGAGSRGSAMVSSFVMTTGIMVMELDDAQKSQKMVEKNGLRALQTFHKDTKQTELQFVYVERFLVSLKAKFLNPDQTWDLVSKLELDKLAK